MSHLPSLGPRGEGWVAVQGILLVLVAAAGWSLGPDWSGWARAVGTILGVAMIAAGVLLAVRGSLDLGTALTPLPRPRPDAELVETGIYATVRHPIYAGLILAGFGWAIARASVVALGLAAALWGFLWVKSAREEAWLGRRFAGYAAYRRRTGRFVPRLRRARDG